MKQILLFLIVGVLCYIIAVVLLMLLVELLGWEVNLANAVSSFITIFICYWLNVGIVFKGGRHSRSREILAFYFASALGFMLNVALMFVLTTFVPIWYVISKTLVTAIVAAFNFIVRKKFIFLD